MIKYYGTPVTPLRIFKKYMMDKNLLVSYYRSDSLKFIIDNNLKFIIDNGAYSFYNNKKIPDWCKFYNWLEGIPERQFFFIPDVIDGTEKENDNLINLCKFNDGVPVFHIHESINRLKNLLTSFDYIALGSSGNYFTIGDYKWHCRMNDLMNILCDEKGKAKVKIHMLRCLNAEIFTIYPFFSGDSSGLARNHKRDGIEKILNNIEPFNSPELYKRLQLNLFDER